jgi:hypothetical protein
MRTGRQVSRRPALQCQQTAFGPRSTMAWLMPNADTGDAVVVSFEKAPRRLAKAAPESDRNELTAAVERCD